MRGVEGRGSIVTATPAATLSVAVLFLPFKALVFAMITPQRTGSSDVMRTPVILVCLGFLATAPAAFAAKPRATTIAVVEPETGLQALDNATQAQVRAKFGEPDVARAEGEGAFWTYRLPDCALFVFFRKEAKVMRVSGLSAGPRRRGEPTPETAECLSTGDRD